MKPRPVTAGQGQAHPKACRGVFLAPCRRVIPWRALQVRGSGKSVTAGTSTRTANVITSASTPQGQEVVEPAAAHRASIPRTHGEASVAPLAEAHGGGRTHRR